MEFKMINVQEYPIIDQDFDYDEYDLAAAQYETSVTAWPEDDTPLAEEKEQALYDFWDSIDAEKLLTKGE